MASKIYVIEGKDPDLSYKFVGSKKIEDYYARGWDVCRKEDHPKLIVPGDRNKGKKEGPFEVGPFVVMCISREEVKELKDFQEKQNAAREGLSKGDSPRSSLKRTTLVNGSQN